MPLYLEKILLELEGGIYVRPIFLAVLAGLARRRCTNKKPPGGGIGRSSSGGGRGSGGKVGGAGWCRDQRDRMWSKGAGLIRCASACPVYLGWVKLAHHPNWDGPSHSPWPSSLK